MSCIILSNIQNLHSGYVIFAHELKYRVMTNLFKYKILLIFSIFAVLLLASCNEKKKLIENDITFETIRATDFYHLDGDSTKPSCSVKLTYVYPSKYENRNVVSKLLQETNYAYFDDNVYENMEADAAVREYITRYIENYKKEAKSTFGSCDKSIENKNFYSFYKIIDSEVLFNKGQLVCYKIKTLDYKGGMNSSTSYKYLVLDLETGKSINEQDIFIEGYKSPLNQLIKVKLLAQYNKESDEELLDLGFFDTKDLASNNNFELEEDGLIYVYNAREIAVASLGDTRIKLSFDELNQILKAKSQISILTGK